jgi:hypothetical protein
MIPVKQGAVIVIQTFGDFTGAANIACIFAVS